MKVPKMKTVGRLKYAMGGYNPLATSKPSSGFTTDQTGVMGESSNRGVGSRVDNQKAGITPSSPDVSQPKVGSGINISGAVQTGLNVASTAVDMIEGYTGDTPSALGGGIKGAASGAAAGAAFGVVGMGVGALAGGVMGYLGQDKANAEAKKAKDLQVKNMVEQRNLVDSNAGKIAAANAGTVGIGNNSFKDGGAVKSTRPLNILTSPIKIPTSLPIRNPRPTLARAFGDGGKLSLEEKKQQLEGDLLSKVIMNRNKNKEFVDRAYNPNQYPQKQEFVDFNQKATHKMAYGDDDKGQSYMFPTIFNEKNEDIAVPNQYAEYISSKGYKNATGLGKEFKNGGAINERLDTSIRLKPTQYTDGGQLSSLDSKTVLAKGNTHAQGGIDIGNNAEIENGETVKDTGDDLMVMSNNLKNPATGNTFAKDDSKLAKQVGKLEGSKKNSDINTIKLLNRKRGLLENMQQIMNGNSQGELV